MSVKYDKVENINFFSAKVYDLMLLRKKKRWLEREKSHVTWFLGQSPNPHKWQGPIIVHLHENAPTYIYYYEIDRCACQNQGKHEHFSIDFCSKLHFSFISLDQTFAN